MPRTLIATAAVAVAASLTLAACSTAGDSDTADSPTAGAPGASGTINTVLWYAPSNFNPATSASSPDYTAAALGFDTLVAKGEDGFVPGLASSWEAADASTYTFTIRDGAMCADGTEITPQVVADSFEYLASAEDSGAQNWSSLAFGQGEPTFTADDEAGTLAISLSEPYSQLIGGLALDGTGIICPAGLADLDGLAAGTVDGAFSGPYTISDYSAGVSVSYALREDYDAWPEWTSVEGEPAQTINITVETDANTSANLLTSGGLDVARFYDSNATRFTESEDFSYVTDDATGNVLLFNEDPSSVFADNQGLRTAAAQAVSAEAFNNAAHDGLGGLMTSVTTSSYQCVSTDESLLQAYEPEAAAEVLEGQTIRMLAMTNWDTAVDYVVEALSAAGADVQLTLLDPSEWSAQLRSEPTTWDLTIRASANTSGLVHQSILGALGPSFADGGVNYTSSDNPEGVALLDAAMASNDPDEQCANLLAAQESILERVDVHPLATSTHYIVARDGINSYTLSGYWDISALRLAS
ncbi:ABC transporter substrate-binding protein [Demequina aestuarii]|uniref:ABC transporter substrate-binding protein n=1 Tax=Demequina aestuarii TaxID=327095 RepID=UPI000784E2A2|nr:ABC transporter substrate-binding protein [Demequina aestuarii]